MKRNQHVQSYAKNYVNELKVCGRPGILLDDWEHCTVSYAYRLVHSGRQSRAVRSEVADAADATIPRSLKCPTRWNSCSNLID